MCVIVGPRDYWITGSMYRGALCIDCRAFVRSGEAEFRISALRSNLFLWLPLPAPRPPDPVHQIFGPLCSAPFSALILLRCHAPNRWLIDWLVDNMETRSQAMTDDWWWQHFWYTSPFVRCRVCCLEIRYNKRRKHVTETRDVVTSAQRQWGGQWQVLSSASHLRRSTVCKHLSRRHSTWPHHTDQWSIIGHCWTSAAVTACYLSNRPHTHRYHGSTVAAAVL